MTNGMTRDDLRAAVASGVIDEAQAVKLQTLSDQRMGYRANMVGDDEPFELFKGFSEIFITVGLVLLMSGFTGLSALWGELSAIPVLMMGLSIGLASYFTKKRRMTLPSIALCVAFSIGLWILVEAIVPASDPQQPLYLGAAGMLCLALFFQVFRLPFAMLVFGLFGLVFISGIVNMIEPPQASNLVHRRLDDFFGIARYFDLRNSPYMAIGTLVFGLLAFVGALYFDTKDPHRVSRHASTAFWLHILAAPALVNTLVMSNYAMGGVGTIISVIILTVFTLLALIIDRRSFLTAGLIYMGLIITSAIQSTGNEWAPIFSMLVLGTFVTVLGASWTQARAKVMEALPDFPGKDRLPPYSDGLAAPE